MGILQGNSFTLPIKVKDCSGKYITASEIAKGQFIIDELEKYYDPENNGEVFWNDEKQSFMVPLSEDETFNFKDKTISWQVRFRFTDGTIDGTRPKKENVYESITEIRLN